MMDKKNLEKFQEEMHELFWSVKRINNAYEQVDRYLKRFEESEISDQEKSLLQVMKMNLKPLDEESAYLKKSSRKAMRTLSGLEKTFKKGTNNE